MVANINYHVPQYTVNILLCPVRGDPKRPPGRMTHQNAKARFIVCTIQAGRDLVKATGAAAARGGPLPFWRALFKGKTQKIHISRVWGYEFLRFRTSD